MSRRVREAATYLFESLGPAVPLLVLLCSSFLWMGTVDAQQSDAGAQGADTPTGAGSVTTADGLKARVKALEAQQDIPAEEKAKLTELLNQGVAAAERADALKVESERLAEQLRRAPERQAEITQALALPAPTFDADVLSADTPPADAETKLRESEAALATARQRVQNLTAALGRQRQRPDAIQANLTETKERLARLEEELKAPPAPG